MKTATFAAATAALLSQANAHYIFETLTAGGTKYPAYTYIRQNSNYNSPVTDLTSTDIRCNVGTSGATTSTVSIAAGSKITFSLDTPVYHQGPISVYMSKAPSTAAAYDGSGGWFKILDEGPTFAGGSSTWPMYGSYDVTIPACLASGDYLVKIQSLAIHNPYPSGLPQIYTECAQITLTGGGSSIPAPTVLIPSNAYMSNTDPGYTVNIYSNFNNYTVPGPAVWSCGGATGSPPPPPPPPVSTPVSTPPKSTSVVAPAPPKSTSTSTPVKVSTTSSAPVSSTSAVALYGQCGGTGWKGSTVCVAGAKCVANGAYYSQCVPS
ncbi:hypothetical protein MMC25_006958 [Agyrium rufum]|nr:hypothetical protein [Agyrium rufum]